MRPSPILRLLRFGGRAGACTRFRRRLRGGASRLRRAFGTVERRVIFIHRQFAFVLQIVDASQIDVRPRQDRRIRPERFPARAGLRAAGNQLFE